MPLSNICIELCNYVYQHFHCYYLTSFFLSFFHSKHLVHIIEAIYSYSKAECLHKSYTITQIIMCKFDQAE